MWFPSITLWQPWASLIFVPNPDWRKDHETRGFPIPESKVGEWVAIHSAARSVRPAELGPGLRKVLERQWGTSYEVGLTHRRVLGLVKFGPSRLTQHSTPKSYADEVAGNWTPNRWAWPILERVPLDEPVPAQGRQGWWRVELEPPPEIGEAKAPTRELTDGR